MCKQVVRQFPMERPNTQGKGVAASSRTRCAPSLVWCVLESHDWFDIRMKPKASLKDPGLLIEAATYAEAHNLLPVSRFQTAKKQRVLGVRMTYSSNARKPSCRKYGAQSPTAICAQTSPGKP